MDQQVARIAAKIRQWRADAGLSLQQLGERCGVSASTIHKIENNQSTPTIAVVLKLAEGLGRRASELVEDEVSESRISITRAEDRQAASTAGGSYIEWVAYGLRDPDLEVRRLIHPAGFDSRSERLPALAGEGVLLVERGELSLAFDDHREHLGPGDCLHFKAASCPPWLNTSEDVVQILVISRTSSPSDRLGRSARRKRLPGIRAGA